MNDDYDTPWKDALTRYFPDFMAFYFPEAYAEIDWTVPHTFLEQELAQVVRDGELGKRRVDKLVQVSRRGGREDWVFVHIDVQGKRDREFAERVFVYNYRIYDRYRRPVASLVMLADCNSKWRPSTFSYSLFGCEIGIRFPTVKLTDFTSRLGQLLVEQNVFGLVTAAHLLTQQTRGQHVERYAAKWRLTRLLYERNWTRQQVIDLFAVIDWMMQVPPPLQNQLLGDIRELERERAMPYMNPFEKLGREEGRQQALCEILELQLEHRFGNVPQAVRDRVHGADADTLMAWAKTLLTAPSLEQVFSSR
jgi:hypothetical protein